MNREDARSEVKRLVEKYEFVKTSGSVSKYTEEETKKGFIEPLFRALGWAIDDRNEVSAEEHQSGGRVDYGFYLNGRLKFYLEAKPLRSDLHREEYANQAVKYSWNKGATWAILTDFESLIVFNSQIIDRSLGDKLVFEIPYTQYVSRFEQLWLLSKEAFINNLLDKDAEEHGKKLQRVSVDTSLYKHLTECRELLTMKLGEMNPQVDSESLDEGVQKLLDRLIFIRVAEDRGIEDQTLIPLIRQWNNSKNSNEIPLYKSMSTKFRELDKTYNSNLFKPHPFENWEDWSNVTEQVVKILQGRPGYYEYDFKEISSDVLGNVYENYLGYRLLKSKDGLTLSKDAKKRKEHGIYYTPSFIVDYIVQNALTPVLDKCKNMSDLKRIKVLDPACGSGSFLIKALDLLSRKYREFDRGEKYHSKMTILINNIFGVDLDPQAVELAKLNLLMSVLRTRAKLPSLDNNIKNGNSLISGTDKDLQNYFGANFSDKNPFNWQDKFPEVFKNGGFDVIISNPPYNASLSNTEREFFKENYESVSSGRQDTAAIFVELAKKIGKTNTYSGFVLPYRLFSRKRNHGAFQKYILNNFSVVKVIYLGTNTGFDVGDEFMLLFLTNNWQADSNVEVALKPEHLSGDVRFLKINQSKWIANSEVNLNLLRFDIPLTLKIEQGSVKLSEICEVKDGIVPYLRDKLISSSKIDSRYVRFAGVAGKYVLNKYYFSCDELYLCYDINEAKKYIQSTIELRKVQLRDKDIFLHRKIITSQNSSVLKGAIDENQTFVSNSLHSIFPKKEYKSKFILEYILALINSSLLNYYHNFLRLKATDLHPQILITDLKRLPIRVISIDDQRIFESIVKKIFTITRLSGYLTNTDKQNEVVEYKGTLDRMVYKLYDLTSEEIDIVETG